MAWYRVAANEGCSGAHNLICLVPRHTFASDHCVEPQVFTISEQCAILCTFMLKLLKLWENTLESSKWNGFTWNRFKQERI